MTMTSPNKSTKYQVGELRPSQLLFTYGVGAIVDLPYISAMVTGLEDWDTAYCLEINESRLLQAVQNKLGYPVSRLLAPPAVADSDEPTVDDKALIGAPVVAFPRWLLCPRCRYLGPIEGGLFQLKIDPRRPDQARYVHANCTKVFGRSEPAAVPARFLIACEAGHMDDFPWVYFVHGGPTDCHYVLQLKELSASGEAAAIQVECTTCGKRKRMSDAFGPEGRKNLPPQCGGRRPHLRDQEDKECTYLARSISLGASNSWFPVILTSLAVPISTNSKVEQLVEEYWTILEKAISLDILKAFRLIGQLPALAQYVDAEIWQAVERRRAATTSSEATSPSEPASLKVPEWKVLTQPSSVQTTRDFKATVVAAPAGQEQYIRQVVLVERLREVQALTGFTRIESPSNYTNVEDIPPDYCVPLSRSKIGWVPAAEVRGEGIFIEFKEALLEQWASSPAVLRHERVFKEAYRKWRQRRKLDPDTGFPAMRYLLLHSFSHALMRQLALECGYSAASIRERIYSLSPTDPDGPMAGVLLYTAASDSEGTLGGLVGLGASAELGQHIDQALEQMQMCASDPLCAEHAEAENLGEALHAAACHACLFAPETSCERGNKYLDRSVLVQTLQKGDLFFFTS